MMKKHLRNYKVISEPGAFIVQVANTTKPEYLIEDGSASRYLVNLRAATMEGFEKCLEAMGPREYILFSELYGCFATGAIWDKDLGDLTSLPVKGEEVIATFEMKDDQLMCTAITLIPRKALPEFNLDAMDKSRRLFTKLMKS
jgi:hypothetical protein